jgi:hypothetical protein
VRALLPYPAIFSRFISATMTLLLLTAFDPTTAQATTCPLQDYALNTQSEVDDLGDIGCTAIYRDLTITGSGITSLSPLSNITSVGGDLTIASNANLGTLDGLDSLTSVTGAVTVNSNGSLYSICDLQNVTTIGGDLVVASNAGLQNAECPWSLQSVGGNIRFEDNPSIWTLSYLRGLTTHSGSLTIHNSMDQLYFGANSPLALTEIGGDLVIEENGINDVDELINLTSVGGALTISGNNSLDDVDGLSSLDSVGGNLTVQSNRTLGDCLGFVPLLGYPNGPDSVGGSVTIASNQSGCNSVSDIFSAVSPPGKPSITKITAGDGQISLTASVSQVGSFPVTGYRGTCKDSFNRSFTQMGSGSSVTVTGLTNGTAYTCTVVALSDGGESQASGESIPVTPEEKPEIDPAVLWLVIKGSGYSEDDDTDKDGFPDVEDECPDLPGDEPSGCPTWTFLEESYISSENNTSIWEQLGSYACYRHQDFGNAIRYYFTSNGSINNSTATAVLRVRNSGASISGDIDSAYGDVGEVRVNNKIVHSADGPYQNGNTFGLNLADGDLVELRYSKDGSGSYGYDQMIFGLYKTGGGTVCGGPGLLSSPYASDPQQQFVGP